MAIIPPDRWARIDSLYHEALARPDTIRLSWLNDACGQDNALRLEIEGLLRFDREQGFLDRSAFDLEVQALTRELPDLRVGRQLGGYEIRAFLGAGGMGEVYRAWDPRLERELALKVFERSQPEDGRGRLEAEARAASVLTHPNIVTIYGVGEDVDLSYIAMELIDGHSLRALLQEGPFPVPRVLEIAESLAEAIVAAHARGIVHRDLKPENVMLTSDGRVKVLDFGIASRGGSDDLRTGAAVAKLGTAAYMSPEQARGLPVGPVSDQFSFGLIVHEMLTGERVFRGATSSDVLAAILSPERVPGPPVSPDQEALAAIVSRCLQKDPALRYGDSSSLAAALRRVRETRQARTRAPLTRRSVMRIGALAVGGTAVGLAGWRLALPPGRPSLTVLPFVNRDRDANTDYLCDGITETLIRRLGGVPGLTVTARATSFAFRGDHVDPRVVGRRLGVRYVMAGTVSRRAGRLLLDAELVETSTGRRVWGARYERATADVLGVQDEITSAILEEGLGVVVPAATRRDAGRGLTGDPVAYDLFLRGVHHIRLETEGDYLAAREFLTGAVTRSPRFALAMVTLGSTYTMMAVDGYAPAHEACPESRRCAELAIGLDRGLPDAHAEAASVAFYYEWGWGEAEREWQEAMRLRSDVQSELLTAYAMQKWAVGEWRSAVDLARAAMQVDPLSPHAAVRYADILATTGRPHAAARAYETTIQNTPQDPRAYFGLAEVLGGAGRYDEAIAARRRAYALLCDTSLDPVLLRARGERGLRAIVRASLEQAMQRLDQRREAGDFVSAIDVARTHAQLGADRRAFEYLDAAIEERAPGVTLLRVDPAWNAFRRDARLASAIRRVGIPGPSSL